MARGLSVAVLATLLVMVANSAAFTEPQRGMSQQSFESMIELAPVIVQGVVARVEAKLVAAKEVSGPGTGEAQIPITEVTMRIEKVIAGEYDSDEIVIVLQEGKAGGFTSVNAGWQLMKVNVGDRAVVALELNSRGTGLNVLDRPSRFFRVEGTDLVQYRGDARVAFDKPLEVMAKKAKERQMPEVVKASDLICTGTVIRLIDRNLPTRRFVVLIDETLKGKAEQPEITVDMSGVYLSSETQTPGFRVLFFLKKEGSGYRPVAGVNGYYEMHGEKLTRGHGTPVKMTATQFRGNIKKLMEVEQ
jgi:hypothetical protein